jgi:hypothetical protein
MRIIGLLFFLLVQLATTAQSSKVAKQINKLDNNQFEIDFEHKASFKLNSKAALKLIKIGKPATEQLLNALQNPNKSIIVHLILCHIWFNEVTFAGPKSHASHSPTVRKYFLGQQNGEGLIISEKNQNLYIQEADLEKIKLFWNRIITQKTPE